MATLKQFSTGLPQKMAEYIRWLRRVRKTSDSCAVRDLVGAGMAYVELVTTEVRRIMSVHRPSVISQNAIVLMLHGTVPGVKKNINLVLDAMVAAGELNRTGGGFMKTDKMPPARHRVTR